MYRDVLKIFLLIDRTRPVVNISCSYFIEYLWTLTSLTHISPCEISKFNLTLKDYLPKIHI